MRHLLIVPLLFAFVLSTLAAPAAAQDFDSLREGTLPPNGLWLEKLRVDLGFQAWGRARPGRSVENRPITINGVVYPNGVGTHATSEIVIVLDGSATRFLSLAGVDDERGGMGSVRFKVVADGETVYRSPVVRGGEKPVPVDVDLTGVSRFVLTVEDGGDGIRCDHADWAGAVFVLDPGSDHVPVVEDFSSDPPPEIATTPKDPPVPVIGEPAIIGCSPGKPFLRLIPVSGKPPLRFAAEGLPDGLRLDPSTGIISGRVTEPGDYRVSITVRGLGGTASRTITIVCGDDKLALTPPMGWNSWNVWGPTVDGQKVKDAADWMVRSGLAAAGYEYINIDDGWQGQRDEKGRIRPNEKFSDMKALADYIHQRGLKFGIYSSPGPRTCAGREGSYQHEYQDARTYAEWGVDYLKYDWCTYPEVIKKETVDEYVKAYRLMRDALDASGRDIVLSICQYGNDEVWKWGQRAGGNLWRTTGDITDTWGSMSWIGFSQAGLEAYAGPGHWNDPDMLVVGRLGWGPNPRETRLGPNEQVVHISLWSLLAAPLLTGCDLSQLDPFTHDLLTNSEVIAVNQDPLGRQASRIRKDGLTEVWAKPLADGTTAVGLFNRGLEDSEVSVEWKDLGLQGKQQVRDLWKKKDLGEFENAFTAKVHRHGVVLVKVGG